jgi:hypothetical protein
VLPAVTEAEDCGLVELPVVFPELPELELLAFEFDEFELLVVFPVVLPLVELGVVDPVGGTFVAPPVGPAPGSPAVPLPMGDAWPLFAPPADPAPGLVTVPAPGAEAAAKAWTLPKAAKAAMTVANFIVFVFIRKFLAESVITSATGYTNSTPYYYH